MYPSAFGEDKNVTFPEDTFMTCSADSTIRFWNLGIDENESNRNPLLVNPFSKHCMRSIFVSNDFSSMKASIDHGIHFV